MLSDLLTYGSAAVNAGSKTASGIQGLLSGNTAALPGTLISLIPSAMSVAGSAMGGSAAAGASALAAGVAPAVASALSLFALPAAVVAYLGSRKLTEQLSSKKRQEANQGEEWRDAMQALPGQIQRRATGMGLLNHLGEVTPENMPDALRGAYEGIGVDLHPDWPLGRAFEEVIEPAYNKAPERHDLEPLYGELMGTGRTDNYVAQLLLTDAAARQGMDTSPYQTWEGETPFYQAARDSAGNVIGMVNEQNQTVDPTDPTLNDWTWDDDFMNSAVRQIGMEVGIDPTLLPGNIGGRSSEELEYGTFDPATGTTSWAPGYIPGAQARETQGFTLTPEDLPGWESGNYGQAIDAYLKTLDPNIVNTEAYKRYQSLPGLASLFG